MCLALALAAMAAEQQHPIREEVVEQVKMRTTSWKPKEVNDNHLRHKSVESIKNGMGNFGNTPKTLGSEFFKTVSHGAEFVYHMVAKMGIKEEQYRLKQLLFFAAFALLVFPSYFLL